jgi:hypothetical protein
MLHFMSKKLPLVIIIMEIISGIDDIAFAASTRDAQNKPSQPINFSSLPSHQLAQIPFPPGQSNWDNDRPLPPSRGNWRDEDDRPFPPGRGNWSRRNRNRGRENLKDCLNERNRDDRRECLTDLREDH